MKRQALFVRQQKERTTLSSPKNKSGHHPRLRYGRVPPRATEQRGTRAVIAGSVLPSQAGYFPVM